MPPARVTQRSGAGSSEPAPASQFSAEKLKSKSLPELVDEFGPLDELIREHKPTLKRHEAYRKEIESRFAGLTADAQATVEGARYKVLIGAKANERKVFDPRKCFAAMKKFAGAKLAEITRFLLEDIDTWVPAGEQEKFLKKDRTGRRTVEAVAKQSTAKAA